MKVLCVDIGGTFIKYAVMDEHMAVFSKGKIKTPQQGRSALIEAIGQLYDCTEQIHGIAISMPGIIDSEKGYCLMGGALGYNDDFYLADALQDRCPVKIVMENDAKCAAMAEATVGSLKDVADGFVLLFGTMIGGAIIHDHKLYKGKHFSAGEVSYINTKADQPPLRDHVWGNVGSAAGLCRLYAEKKAVPMEQVDGHRFFDAVANQEPDALECLQEYAYQVAVQIFNIQTVLDPERIAIGGGISEQPILIAYIKKNLKSLYEACPYHVPEAQIVPCKFRNDANLIGALQCYLTASA